MTGQRRSDMIASTRAKLITAGRQAFTIRGYAEATMVDLTADAELAGF